MQVQRKLGTLLLAAMLAALVTVHAGAQERLAPARTHAATPVPKPMGINNVILFIPDGMSAGAVTLARWYAGGAPLAIDALASGLVRTYNADTPIADSAPAGTAFATGFKTNTPYIGVLPSVVGMWGSQPLVPGNDKGPVASVLEAAKLSGKSTGLIATCELPHATPAAFSAHAPSRKAYDDILEQQVYNNVDIVLAGGATYLTQRADKEDLGAALKEKGYTFITSPSGLADVASGKAGKTWGLFAPVAMAYEFDRDAAKEPSLAEMTTAAIAALSLNKNGFFLMVEASKVDWAAHANDPVGIVSDVLAYDAAVDSALQFASGRSDTIILSVSDHGNSGITIGDSSTSGNYYATPLSAFIDPLKKAKLTGEGLEARLNADRSNAKDVMAYYYGITDLSDDELASIVKTKNGSMNYTVGPMIAKRAKIGFTTTGHTGEETVLYCYAPDASTRLVGTVQNTDIARYIEQALNLDLAAATSRLFAEAKPLFAAIKAESWTDVSDPHNPVFVAVANGKTVRIPENKDFVLLNGTKITTAGVNVYIADTGKWYIDASVVNLLAK